MGDLYMLIEYQTRLYDLREEMELTQKEIANILQTSRQNYTVWETNSKFIPLKHLNNYCNIFNVSMDYVFKLDNNRVKPVTNNIKSLDRKLIGKRLKCFMKENNITQDELASLLNTTQSTISAYINGKTLILTAFIYQISKKFNISMDYLTGRIN